MGDPQIDVDLIDKAVLALKFLTLHRGDRQLSTGVRRNRSTGPRWAGSMKRISSSNRWARPNRLSSQRKDAGVARRPSIVSSAAGRTPRLLRTADHQKKAQPLPAGP